LGAVFISYFPSPDFDCNSSLVSELQISLARTRSQALSIALLDIDFFKSINDQMGHAGGDMALTAFAQALQTHFPKDTAGRLGGEEFALISQATEDDLAKRLDIFRKLCTRLNYLPNAPILSFSAGVAELQSGTLEAALNVADQRLYEAKRNGRGQTLFQ
jgi:diguanylate cyclase (GGDEF)-like protein